jgi:hypothetical protein
MPKRKRKISKSPMRKLGFHEKDFYPLTVIPNGHLLVGIDFVARSSDKHLQEYMLRILMSMGQQISDGQLISGILISINEKNKFLICFLC